VKLARRPTIAAAVYALAYASALAVLARSPGFDAGETLGSMLIFGLLFSGIAWLATRGIGGRAAPVRAPGPEAGLITVYLVLFALLVLGFGLSWLEEAVPAGRGREVAVLGLKLATMVAIPGWLFVRRGYHWRDVLCFGRLDASRWRAFLVMATLLLAMQLLVGQGPRRIAALGEPGWVIALASVPALGWMTLEAGLTEEFLFRVLLQTRLAAWLRSETAGVVGMSLLFGLAHAPGYVLRGAFLMEGMSQAPDPLTAAAYSIAVVSPIGLMFGVLWARTRSLTLLVLLHGWADLVPNLGPFWRTWFG